MNRIEYLKQALKAGCFKKKAWIISAFAIINEAPDAYKADSYPFRIIQSPTNFSFVGGNGELEVIEGVTPGKPLFTFKEKISVGNDVCANLTKDIDSTIGNVLVNLICIVSVFGNKFPFIEGRIAVSNIEKVIASKLKDTPETEADRSAEFYYVDEYIKFVDAIQFIAGLSQLCVVSATEKTMTPPIGLPEFKAQLLKKYEGKLSDLTELAKFEQELVDFDNAYLKGDAADETFLTGKIRNIARKKMFLTMGAEAGFGDSQNAIPIINSLEEGWSTDPEQFTAMMNTSRSGSYSRGTETVKGGVSAKILLRAASNFIIVPDDCGTELGLKRVFDKSNINQLVGRYVRVNDKWELVENIENASNIIGKEIIVRSIMFCKSDGDTICKYCAGMRLSENPTGLTTPLTEVSSIILATSMAAMHSKGLLVIDLDLDTTLT